MYYQKHIFFCCNQREGGRKCCADEGAKDMRDYAKKRLKEQDLSGRGGVRVNVAGCLGRCSEGPVLVIYPEGTWYTYKKKKDIDEIIEQEIVQGKSVNRLKLSDSSKD